MTPLSKLIHQDSIILDKRILNSLEVSAEAVVNGASVTVTHIGRESATARGISEKQSIKRSDRLIGNTRLHDNRLKFYQHICTQFISTDNPMIIIDWSSVYNYNYVMIRASLPIKGRAITIYEEVYPQSKHTSQSAHKAFLKNLNEILPPHIKPIFCTDAGFKIPWVKMIESYGWYWITRVRNNVNFSNEAMSTWLPVSALHNVANGRPRELGQIRLAKAHQHPCRSVIVKRRYRGRKNLNRQGVVTKCRNNKVHAKAAKEPWLLTTNLPAEQYSAKDISNYYGRRMTIEETFRDNKNEYYGLGLSTNRSRTTERIENLLLIATIAQIALYIIGKYAEMHDIQKYFQANTIRNRRVLSYGYLALRIIQSGLYLPTLPQIRAAIDALTAEVNGS